MSYSVNSLVYSLCQFSYYGFSIILVYLYINETNHLLSIFFQNFFFKLAFVFSLGSFDF